MRKYVFYRDNETSREFIVDQLITLKFALKRELKPDPKPDLKSEPKLKSDAKPPISGPEKSIVKPLPKSETKPKAKQIKLELWQKDEELYMLDEDVYETLCSRREMKFVGREEKDGIYGYKFKTETGRDLFYSAMQLKTMHVFKPKG